MSIVSWAVPRTRPDAFDQDIVHQPRTRFVLDAALAHRLQKLVDGPGQLSLDLHIPHLALAIALLQIVHLVRVGVKGVVVDKHRIALDTARNVGPHPLGIGVHAHHLAAHRLGIIGQEMALPRLLLILPWPSVPTRVGTSPSSRQELERPRRRAG